MSILPWNLRIDPTPLDSYCMADDDKVLYSLYLYPPWSILTKLITQRENAFNKWRDTFDKINDWNEFIETKPTEYSQYLKDLVPKHKYDNDQIN